MPIMLYTVHMCYTHCVHFHISSLLLRLNFCLEPPFCACAPFVHEALGVKSDIVFNELRSNYRAESRL